jgi:hypothetical protein
LVTLIDLPVGKLTHATQGCYKVVKARGSRESDRQQKKNRT